VDDNSLRSFIKAWGPLRHYPPKEWKGSDPVVEYRRERDTLAAWVRLITAIQDSGNMHGAVIDLLLMNAEPYAIHLRALVGAPVHRGTGLDDELKKRLANASENEIETVCSFLVGAFPFSSVPAFELHRNSSGRRVRATLGIHSLVPALYWMVWQDTFMQEPIRFCKECSHLIPEDSKHEKKFCSSECARRKTGREWQRRKRAKEKTTNVPRKAR
jgi:predicted nucleic acid-binding Zn ribbon protein